MAESQRSNSRIRTYLVAAGAGVAVAVVDYLLGVWMAARGLHAEMTFVDEILLAIFTCALVFVIESSHRRDRDRMSEKLKIIKLMNHHVRNALQTIVTSAYAHGHNRQVDEIRTSVKRIEWALREILPGRVLDNYDEPETLKKESSSGHPAA